MNHKTDMQAAFDAYYAENWPLCKASIEKGTAGEEITDERGALLDAWQDAWKAALASRPDAQADEPVAYEFQHDETGRTTFVDPWQVEQGFASNNPRWQLIGPVFRYARAAAPQAPNAQHEKSNLYKEGYAAGKKVAQESFAKLISCDPNDEALGLICEALALKPEGDIAEAILGAIEELKTKVGIEAEAAQGPENIEEGLEILDNFIANVREYGNYSAEATLTFIAQARQCFAAAPSPDREQVGETEADARRMRTLCRLLDAMDDMGNGFPGEVHAAFQDGAKRTREALDAQRMPGD